MADIIYNSFRKYMADGTIDMDSDTFKIALLTSSYTPNAAHTIFGDVSGNEITGTGYTAGGATLASVTWTYSGGTATFDAADVSWSGATFTCRYAVIYKSGTANAIANPLVKLFDFTSDKSCSNGPFSITFNASGILTLS